MIRDIVKDDAILSQVCEAATAQDAPIAEDLVETLLANEEAACLAANQIGEVKAIIAYLDENDKPQVMYNPKLKQGLQPFKSLESCLSHDDDAKVTRFGRIMVAYDIVVDGELQSRKKKMEGWTAQLVQHMIDHCKGKLV